MGYYRVNYDEATWHQLTSSLASLSNINRAGLADDALNLARAGLLRSAKVHIQMALPSVTIIDKCTLVQHYFQAHKYEFWHYSRLCSSHQLLL
jgi:hypothetical protein